MSIRKRRMDFAALDLAPLPVTIVSGILGRSLAPGTVHFSAVAQSHAFERHGEQFLACLPHVEATVLFPEYIGQSPRYPEGFEMVRRADGILQIGGFVLVALTLAPDEAARYLIQSVYPINADTVGRRRRKRHLFCVQ